MRCIGHGGASALAPANSLRSFRLAAEAGADVIEFDVRVARGRLVLAHAPWHAARPCLTLDEALDALAGPRFADLGLVADLKTRGTEAPVLDALRRRGLLGRTTIASQCPPIIDRVRAHAPAARTAISVAGWASRRLNRWGAWRDEVVAGVRSGRFSALMAHRRVVDEALVDRVARAGGELVAWTVRGHADVRALAALGVDGVVADDPAIVRAALSPVREQPRVQRAMRLDPRIADDPRPAVAEQFAG